MTPNPSIQKTTLEISQLVGGTLEGDGSIVIDGAAELQEAGPAHVSFLGNPKYARAAQQSRAGCLLLPAKGKKPSCTAKARILVDDPQFAFSKVLALIASLRKKPLHVVSPKADVHHEARMGPDVSVGPFAVLERGALVGEGTVIGAQCFIGENVHIGRGCLIHPHVVIREDCVIGNNVILQPGVVIGGDGYGFSTDKKTGRHRKIPQIGNVVLENDVEIGANTTIDRATIGSTVVGAGTKIDDLVMLAHNVKTGKDCLIVSQAGVSGSTILGDRVVLAGQVGVVGHLNIGDGAIVMAQSGVMSDIPPGEIVWSTPSRPRVKALKIQALLSRLPEIYETIKKIRKERKAVEGS